MKHWKPPSPDDVRALRSRYNMTQVELAELAHVLPRHVQRWEANEKSITHQSPRQDTWELILIKLGEVAVDSSLRRRAAATRRNLS